jgi:deoxyhypusine monooxygenase
VLTLDRHEIAFVFGQMLSPHSVPALLQVLQNPHESDMVRHEAAEALGGIATPEVLPYLKEYMTREDAPIVVRESCQIALDMYEVSLSSFSRLALRTERLHQYENSDQFQYANGLDTTQMTEVVDA